MEWFELKVGLEHLMTGLCLHFVKSEGNHAYQFERESASIVRVVSNEDFYAVWNQNMLNATPTEKAPQHWPLGSIGGLAQWYGMTASQAITREWQRLYDSRHDRVKDPQIPGEPKDFPQAVVEAMVRKHGARALHYLALLRWAGDHWFYEDCGMYVGVEPDGYIHT